MTDSTTPNARPGQPGATQPTAQLPLPAVIAGGGERAVAAWILVGVGAIGLAIFAAWGSAAAPPMPPDESPPGAAYRPPWAGFVPLE
jgi:hypothetical protein